MSLRADIIGAGKSLRHVLVVALSFPPSAAPAAIPAAHMAKFLPLHGWRPTFLTIRPERLLMPHAAGDAYPLPLNQIDVCRTNMIYPWDALARLARRRRGRDAATPWTDAIPVSATPAPLRPSFRALLESLLKFPDVQCGWLPFAVWGGLRVASRRRIDCLYSIGPPWTSHLVGLLLHHLLGRPWIADFHDPWLANPWHQEARARPLARFEAWLEQRVLRSARVVVTKAPEMAEQLAARAGRAERDFTTIPCAFDSEEIKSARRLATKDGSKFTLVHAGRFYGRRSPVPLLTALARLAQDAELGTRLELRLVAERQTGIEALAQRLGVSQLVNQVGLCSHLETLRHVLESDLAVVVQPDTAVQIPSKVYEYLGCGVPILALTGEGATARLVRETQSGLVVGAEDIPAIAAAIRAFHRRQVAVLPLHPDRGAVERFEAREVIGRTAELLDRVCRVRNPAC
jgi:glycosyltransferase involved in cell wall biosynthesis